MKCWGGGWGRAARSRPAVAIAPQRSGDLVSTLNALARWALGGPGAARAAQRRCRGRGGSHSANILFYF